MPMIRLAVGLFLIVMPVLELVLLVRIGQSIGALWTVVLVVAMIIRTNLLPAV